jgi:aspartyl-tRNA(Asn)/glutamyl-tRNA(Gln) amidotransferase subunit A
MSTDSDDLSASEIAAVAGGKMSAASVMEAALAQIAKHDSSEFLHRRDIRSRPRQGRRSMLRSNRQIGPLAGIALRREKSVRRAEALHPRRIKDQSRSQPYRDAVIERMEAAGAVLVGALNMGRYAYDFTGENVHDGPSRNPRHPNDRRPRAPAPRSGAGWRAGAGFRHERIDPRAVVVLRDFRSQADLWPSDARRELSFRRLVRSSGAVRA